MRSKPPHRPGDAPRDLTGPKRPPKSGFTPRGPRPAPNTAAPRAAAPEEARERGPQPARPKPPRDRSGAGPRPSRPPERGQERGQDRGAPKIVIRPQAPALGQPRPAPEPAAPERPILRAPVIPAAPRDIGPRDSGSRDSGPRDSGPRDSGPRDSAPRGSVWLHGQHAVAAALANPDRRLKRLLLTEEAEAALTERQPQPWPLAPERSTRAKIDALLGRDTVHQGVALLADLLSPPPLATVLERPGPIIMLDQVTDPRNIGAVLRSAAAFGAAGVIMQDRNTPEETGVLAKAASGALETMPLLRAVNLARTLAALKAAGCWVIGLDAGGAVLRGEPLKQRRVVLVLGAEGDGLRRLTRDTCDELAGLAMPGGMESLNVSAAATVALYELTRDV